MANREREPQPNKHTKLRIGLAVTAVGFLGAAGAVTTGRTILGELSKQRVSASEKQEGGIMPSKKAFNELVTETPSPTLIASPTIESTSTPIPPTETTIIPTPFPTETPKPIPTATSTPTPEPSPTPSPTATREASPTPKQPEKSPLPTYGAFWGDLFNDQTGAKEGMIVVASIPPAEGPEQIFVYYITNDQHLDAFLLNLKKVQGNNFESTNPATRLMSAGTYTVNGEWDSSRNALKGTITRTTRPSGQLKTEVRNFQTSFVGTGREKVLEAAKKMKLKTGKYGAVDWSNIRVDELQKSFQIVLP